jgi:biopolymer transport protein ExbD
VPVEVKAQPVMAAPNVIPKTVFVRSDARAKFGQLKAAVDELRAAGADHIGILTERVSPRRKEVSHAV